MISRQETRERTERTTTATATTASRNGENERENEREREREREKETVEGGTRNEGNETSGRKVLLRLRDKRPHTQQVAPIIAHLFD